MAIIFKKEAPEEPVKIFGGLLQHSLCCFIIAYR